jgi:hypothetical protein
MFDSESMSEAVTRPLERGEAASRTPQRLPVCVCVCARARARARVNSVIVHVAHIRFKRLALDM